MILRNVQVRPIRGHEEIRYKSLMEKYHYLGALPKIGETLWYIAAYDNLDFGQMFFVENLLSTCYHPVLLT